MSDTKKSPADAPWVPGAVARRTVALLTLTTIILAGVSAAMIIAFIKVVKEPPKLVTNNLGTFVEAQLTPVSVSRDDVERFVQLVIPRLYAQSDGESPGLEQIKTLVNTNILSTQLADMEAKSAQLQGKGITQFAIVNGINPNTMVINRTNKTIYAEAVGLIGLTDKKGKAQTVPTQWQMLIYMVDIIPTSKTSVSPGTELIGNERGLYLQQYREQAPGTINDKVPKPTSQDLTEYEEQKKLRNEKAALIRLLRNNATGETTAPTNPENANPVELGN